MLVQSGSISQPPATPTAPTAPTSPTSADQAVIVGETPAQGKITITKNGKTITLDGAGGPATVLGGGPGGGDLSGSTAFPFPSDIPPGVQSIATTTVVGLCLAIAAYPVFGFLKALVNRSASRQAALPSRDTTDRLARIESAVEAMSVEVERISEGQRFVTRVLSERSSAQT
jgi:hypothetical protein